MQATCGAEVGSLDGGRLRDAARSGRPDTLVDTAKRPLPPPETVHTLAAAVVAQWADPALLRGWQPHENAYLSHVVMLLLCQLRGDGIERSATLLRSVLQVRCS